MPTTSRARCALVAAASSASLAVLATHRPGALIGQPDDPTSGVAGAAAWGAWLLGCYLLMAFAAAAAGRLRPGSAAARLARAAAPRPVRRVVDALVGVGTAALVATAAPMAAYADTPAGGPTGPSGPTGPAPTVVASLDWPGLAPHRDGPPRPAPRSVAAGARTAGERLVVRSGDSLWTLAARRLGPGASAADIAAEWPRLYAANRSLIGADPDLLHPGQRLALPAHDPRSPQ